MIQKTLILFFVLCSWLVQAAEWSHVLPADLYRELNQNQRAGVDKALDLYEKGGEGRNRKEQLFHKSAANEWERFRVQYGDQTDPAIFAYTLFMQALSQREALDRHTAVKTFTEVLDFFPDEIWLAAPALYFRAMTHYDIGDEKKGLTDLLALLKDPDYRLHPLAGYGYLRVADNHWENQRTAEAVNLWETVAEVFKDSNPKARGTARRKIRDWYLVSGKMEEAYQIFLDGQRKGNEVERQINAVKNVWREMDREWDKDLKKWYFEKQVKKGNRDKQREAVRAQYLNWFENQETLFAQGGQTWDYLMMQFEDLKRDDPEKLQNFITKLSAFLRKGEADKQSARAKALMDKLLRLNEYDIALTLLEFLPTPAERFWFGFKVETERENYEQADRILDQIMALKDGSQSDRVLRARANLYHREMGKYKEAIKLYYEINDPPDTLWKVVDCQRRASDKQAAQNTLTEIASIFPDEAARAIFAKAEYFRNDGEKDRAVGLYRNLLAHPEWKKSPQASRAHDRLEDMGIATGGAVINEVN